MKAALCKDVGVGGGGERREREEGEKQPLI